MELPIDLQDYLKIDIKEKDSIDKLFELIMEYLDELKSSNYYYEFIIPISGIINKFYNCAKYIGVDSYELMGITEDFVTVIDEFSEYVDPRDNSIIKKIILAPRARRRRITKNGEGWIKADKLFQSLYSRVIYVYNEVKNYNPLDNPIKLDGFYQPDNSNKQTARKLITEAINELENDNTLSAKAKKAIIDYLHKALIEFDKPSSNWTLIFGQLKQSIIILGALGSIAGGIANASPLFAAKEKIEEATVLVEKTSININYQNINQIFNFENGITLTEQSQPKILLERNKEE